MKKSKSRELTEADIKEMQRQIKAYKGLVPYLLNKGHIGFHGTEDAAKLQELKALVEHFQDIIDGV